MRRRLIHHNVKIPVISLKKTPENCRGLAEALKEYGCCYIEDHGISEETQKKVLESSRSFFALSDNQKASIPVVAGTNGFTRGYIGIGKESGSANRIEVKEAFSYGYEYADKKKHSFSNSLEGHNVWPEASGWDSAHKMNMNSFYDSMVETSRKVLVNISRALYGDERYLDQFTQEGHKISIMRLFHYFPYTKIPSKPSNGMEYIGSSPHTDWGFLTLILQDATGGLEFFHDDKWIDVPFIPGTIVLNAGDYLSLMTDGRCMSPVHRVISDDKERLSAVFFYYPDFDAKIPTMSRASRIGGDQSSKHKFNNLLDETVKNSDSSFGEYIMKKWAGVQR